MYIITILITLKSLFAMSPQINETTSMIQLISNPDKYHNKHIRLVAFLNIEFEGNALYLHQEDYKNDIYSNGIWLSVNEENKTLIKKNDLNKRYVLIEGVFNKENKGHMGMWQGSLEKVTRIISWGD